MFPGYYDLKTFVLKFLSDGQSSSTHKSVLGEATDYLNMIQYYSPGTYYFWQTKPLMGQREYWGSR